MIRVRQLYPNNLIYTMYRKNIYKISSVAQIEDIRHRLEYLIEMSLDDVHKEIIYSIFKDGKASGAVGKQMGLSQSQIINKMHTAIDKMLDYDKHYNVINNGVDAVEHFKETLPQIIKKYPGDVDIYFLNLNNRVYHWLRQSNIYTVGDLLKHDEKSLLKMKGIGCMSVFDIINVLKQFDVKLR